MNEEINIVVIPFDEKNIHKRKIFCNQILFFSSNTKNISIMKNKIKDIKIILYIVGHHKHFGRI